MPPVDEPDMYFVKTQLTLLVIALIISCLWVKPVAAHALLSSAEPQPGERLFRAPSELMVQFNEAIGPASTAQLYGSGFKKIGDVEAAVSLSDRTLLIISVPELPADTYTVLWTAQSSDFDLTSGSYSFQVTGSLWHLFNIETWVLLAATVTILLPILWRRKRVSGGRDVFSAVKAKATKFFLISYFAESLS